MSSRRLCKMKYLTELTVYQISLDNQSPVNRTIQYDNAIPSYD